VPHPDVHLVEPAAIALVQLQAFCSRDRLS
jgi:hypothetical protein